MSDIPLGQHIARQKQAFNELSVKTLAQIQAETAYTWAYRAWAARHMGLRHDAVEYEHEAVEHAALTGSDEVLAEVRQIIGQAA